ncbi:MAG: DMT family transporter [Armatimonadota bacterium]|nr:DMT family transporter [Armatimonadota bacterium]MDR7450908.1 DMT family transporter [Armatimonadota bacterium]MDR7465830.1 DMT family transporter [Armatimonadota bacterium]MDR7493738.1 DMT family transporter [Armatimonadota bacterium]MDR7498344.1 DMT family transporter [Armatimonadota bacterium]
MSPLALLLVLLAAGIHAFWNYLVKRIDADAAALWMYGTLSAICYLPLALGLVLLRRPQIGPAGYGFMAGSAVLHIGYFLFLQRGYRAGDLSVVYPVARGTGPLLTTAGAIVLLNEPLTGGAATGTILIASGIFLLAGGLHFLRARSARIALAVRYGVITGVFIGMYSLWDKYAVSALLVPPILMDWGTSVTRSLLLAPVAALRWTEVRDHWARHRRPLIGIAVLSPLSYILVLTAMVFTPVSYVAPAREVSILIGTAMGTQWLAEGHTRHRLAGAAAMVAGLAVLALG